VTFIFSVIINILRNIEEIQFLRVSMAVLSLVNSVEISVQSKNTKLKALSLSEPVIAIV
jgi:hypothetical protein